VYTGPERRKSVDYASQVQALRFVIWVMGAILLLLVGLTATMSTDLLNRVAAVEQHLECHMKGRDLQCEGG
jgi:hypothetical protein